MHHLLFIAIASVWGSSFILMKIATGAFGALRVGGLRLASGAATLGLVLWLWRRHRALAWRPDGRQLGLMVLVVAMSYAWPYCLQPWLIHRHGSGFIGMLVAFVPLLTVLAQIPVLGRRASLRECAGVLGGLAALAVILTDGRLRDIPLAHLALAVTVPAGYALGNTLVRRHFATVPTIALTAWCLLIASVLVLPLAVALDPLPTLDAALAPALLAIAVIGVLGTGGAICGLYYLIQRRGPLWAGMVTYLIPLGAVLWAWIDGEAVTLLQLLALGVVLAMVALVQLPGRRASAA